MSFTILKLKLKRQKDIINKIIHESYNALFTLYYLILEDTIENIIYESINIILGYLQLIIFIFDNTVRYIS
jgi:hypothetical protein